ncbi:cytochrome P450 7B1 [Brachionichthys hirsutus]|uniref:cytochrome P450 7B1 n=1 Tax=Brachionichthys hirsutus TaxID=412623 RepID=UPI00360503CE
MSPLLLLLLGLLLLCVLRGRRRRAAEPPLIKGWIPFLGKVLEFGRDPYAFLEEQKKTFGDVFTVHIAGKYMTFIMDPFMYPSVVKNARQLDFHKFSNRIAPIVFGYPSVRNFPGLHEEVLRTFKLLQGDNLTALTESMMGNLMLLFRQDHMGGRAGGAAAWKSAGIYEFCYSVMFEANFLTIYGRPASAGRHREMNALREDFAKFDSTFPLLVVDVPIGLLRQAKASRDKLLDFVLPRRISCLSDTSLFVRRRAEMLDHRDAMRDVDKAGHHFAMLWASVANTVPASFWALYHLVSHPEALEVVRQEIHDVLNLSGSPLATETEMKLGREQLDQLLYMESSIKESLRLSSASMNIRVAEEDFDMQLANDRSAAVRRGDIIVLYPQSLHMDPGVYEEPQTFKFDRYVQDGREKSDFYKDGRKLKYFYMPFGSGATKCPGRHLAVNEIKELLCILLLYFDLELEEGQSGATVDSSRAGLGILAPAADVRFRYRPRACL